MSKARENEMGEASKYGDVEICFSIYHVSKYEVALRCLEWNQQFGYFDMSSKNVKCYQACKLDESSLQYRTLSKTKISVYTK